MKIYVQSQWRVALLWHHIFWQSSFQKGRHTKVCIILLNGLSKFAQNFTVGFPNIAFYSPKPHSCLGKLFKYSNMKLAVQVMTFALTPLVFTTHKTFRETLTRKRKKKKIMFVPSLCILEYLCYKALFENNEGKLFIHPLYRVAQKECNNFDH